MADAARTEKPTSRIGIFDVLRGLAVISMVLFHFCYDYVFIAGKELAWFEPPFRDIWRASISWTFLFVAGCMCSQSRSNFKRGGVYAAVALALYVVTLVAAVDTPISFGIIFCMAASTLIYACLQRFNIAPRGYAAALILFALFICCLPLAKGNIGIGPLSFELPASLYSTPYLSWLGLPGPGFASGDYYPLLPYSLLYLSGAAAAAVWAEKGYPESLVNFTIQPFSWVGRHALLIYVLHQPVILALLQLF